MWNILKNAHTKCQQKHKHEHCWVAFFWYAYVFKIMCLFLHQKIPSNSLEADMYAFSFFFLVKLCKLFPFPKRLQSYFILIKKIKVVTETRLHELQSGARFQEFNKGRFQHVGLFLFCFKLEQKFLSITLDLFERHLAMWTWKRMLILCVTLHAL